MGVAPGDAAASAALPMSARRRGPSLRVVVTDRLGRPTADRGLRRWLVRVAPVRARGALVVALVSDAHMRQLNRRFAGRDSLTDVLTFPAAGQAGQLGDIVIATGVAARQARRAGHSLRTELRVLALHGLLHILGYDHHADRGTMARLEHRLRRKGHLREGLIERAGPS
jgi:probable rRNA maturation factor